MKLLLILSGVLAAQAGVARRDTACVGPVINGVHYTEDVLKTDIDRPYLLSIDYSTNTVYFSYSANPEDDEFKSAKIILNTKEFTNIEGVPNGFAQSVDLKTHDVYIGGSDGIYKYNKNSDKAEFYGANGTNIWTVFFKQVLYFSDYPSQFLYTIVDGEKSRVKDLEDTKVDHFVIDNSDYLFYTNDTGLYSQKKGTKDADYYKNSKVMSIRGLTTDKYGNVYACVQDGIYSVNKKDFVLEKILDVDDAFGVAFDDKNNIVLANARALVWLKANQECK